MVPCFWEAQPAAGCSTVVQHCNLCMGGRAAAYIAFMQGCRWLSCPVLAFCIMPGCLQAQCTKAGGPCTRCICTVALQLCTVPSVGSVLLGWTKSKHRAQRSAFSTLLCDGSREDPSSKIHLCCANPVLGRAMGTACRWGGAGGGASHSYVSYKAQLCSAMNAHSCEMPCALCL